ncbi:septation ring formation regulator EzrA [Exiguobacterium antarcticum]|uniref:Septation ring formation regulator EzrA n=1 Tax=Exiguobacterium antarcticum TaxID=132920 RepID=A0ABT6QXH5_9BACL|nr:septation ring formation regulator EzrA [Exiguobacterium antarcticum]AFS71180.1 Septation ring formation regulator EzrA [Exiguobacterium antarcticum B7]MDI3233392.1 septation ring formation regulator EzrA [Exiguobacterium antarcticum]
MWAWVIGVIVIVLLVMLFSMISRKKYYTKIDELDLRKQGIISASIPKELQELKELPMAGETETKFTSWHQAWEELVTVHVAQIDETLYRAEEGLDGYRFVAVKNDLEVTEQLIAELEGLIDEMLTDMSTFKTNQSVLAELKAQGETHSSQVRKSLLLQATSFGPALPKLEEQAETIDQLRTEMGAFEEAGEVTKAYETSLQLETKVEETRQLVEVIPQHWKTLAHELRQRIDQLSAGYKEMTLDGYPLEPLGMQSDIKRFEEQRLSLVKKLEFLEIVGLEEQVQQLASDIDQMYDTFRREVDARHHVKKENQSLKQKALRMREKVHQLAQEFSMLRENYEISADLGEHYESIQRDEEMLFGAAKDLDESIASRIIPFSMLEDQMRDAVRLEEQLMIQYERFTVELQALRKEETEVRQRVAEWRQLLSTTRLRLKRLGLPKIPADVEEALHASSRSLQTLESRLEELPFNVNYIVSQSEDVNGTFRLLQERIDKLVFEVTYAERLVQYANRFRRHDNEIHMSLTIAETKFLAGDYERTITLGERVLEQFDPGSIERIRKACGQQETMHV